MDYGGGSYCHYSHQDNDLLKNSKDFCKKGTTSIMRRKNTGFIIDNDIQITPSSVEDMIEKKLEDICTVLCSADTGKNRLHEEVMSIVEKGLFKIALKRSNNVKSAAATYLGINRNTFQNKMEKLGINNTNDLINAQKQK